MMKREREVHKVVKTQGITEKCIICGSENPFGMHGQFLELDDGGLMGVFQPNELLQSYPDRIHGGILSGILDELMCRTVSSIYPDMLGVTLELNLKYRKSVPMDRPITALAYCTKDRARIYDAEGKILLEDGSVAVEATGRFLRVRPADVDVEVSEEGGAGMTPDLREYPDEVEI